MLLEDLFLKIVLIHVSLGKISLPVPPGIDWHAVRFLPPDPGGVRTHRQTGVSPWLCSLGLPGVSSGREGLMTLLLSGNTCRWLVLEIPDQAPGPAGFVNTSCCGCREPVPGLPVGLLQFGEITEATGPACASPARLGFGDNSWCLFGELANSELFPRISPSRSNLRNNRHHPCR